MSKDLEGARIVKIREMTRKEATNEGWDLGKDGCRALELSNGTVLYASRDYEGNGPGALFFYNKEGAFCV